MPLSTGAIAYKNLVEQRLVQYIAGLRHPQVEQFLDDAFWYFSHTTENFSAKVTKHQQQHTQLSVFVLIGLDALRSAIKLQENVSIPSLALLQRTSFEIHCNLLFIFQSTNPLQYLDRMNRFSEVEKLKHFRQDPAWNNKAEENRITALCPEWIDPTGKILKDRFHWTAEIGKNFREISKAVNKEPEYISLYSTNSKFVHGSSIVINMFKTPQGIHFIGNPKNSARMAVVTAMYWVETLTSMCNFLGVPYDVNDYSHMQQSFLSLVATL